MFIATIAVAKSFLKLFLKLQASLEQRLAGAGHCNSSILFHRCKVTPFSSLWRPELAITFCTKPSKSGVITADVVSALCMGLGIALAAH